MGAGAAAALSKMHALPIQALSIVPNAEELHLSADPMIDAKQAVQIAKRQAAEVLGQTRSVLEEIERDDYHGRDSWAITLSMPRDLSLLPIQQQFGIEPLAYKRFVIDAETGELVAMKLREPALP